MSDVMPTESPSLSRRLLSASLFAGAFGLSRAASGAGAERGAWMTAELGGAVEDHLAIEQLIYRYAMSVDDLDTVAFKSCFVPGAVIEGGKSWSGDFAAALIDFHRQFDCTMHLMINHLHRIRGGSATGMTYGIASWVKNDNGARTKLDLHIRYHDELVKTGGLWLFSKRRVEVPFMTESVIKNFAGQSGRAGGGQK